MALTRWTESGEVRRLVATYKGGERFSEAERSGSRKAILAIFEAQTGIRPGGDGAEALRATRAEAWDSADKFEALVCAYVAILRRRGETTLAGSADPIEDQDLLAIEGAAVLPRLARKPK
jgi:hypothetical protein